jgi:UDP-3-O-[3-hydroxymyristoyl] glucosamine N-acyltransferase
MRRSLTELARAVEACLDGDGSIEVSGVASISAASAEDLVFVEDAKYLPDALRSKAAAVIVGAFAKSSPSEKPLLISDHPKLAFARAARFLASQDGACDSLPQKVHLTAVVHPSARLAVSAVVEACAVIAEDVVIGEKTRIGSGSAIGAGVKIGRDCQVYSNVTIYPGTTLGNRVIVHAGAVLGSDGFGYVRDRKSGRYEKFPQAGRLVIEDDVEIGANTAIDRGALDETRIGSGTKIDNLVHVGHNCRIGQNVVIAAQVGLSGSVVIEDNAVIGGQVGMGEHARVGEGVLMGGQAGVLPHKIVRGKGVAFWGTPARPVREYLKQLAALARLGKR